MLATQYIKLLEAPIAAMQATGYNYTSRNFYNLLRIWRFFGTSEFAPEME